MLSASTPSSSLGTPMWTLSLWKASLPRAFLWGSMPLMVLRTMALGFL